MFAKAEHMGIRFCNNQHETLSDMSNGRAHLFISMAELAVEHYGLFSTGLSDVRNSECYVEETQFCRLVEAVLASPFNLFYAWAEEAAAIYEVLNKTRCHWEWPSGDTPHFPFRPIRQLGLVPELEAQKIIGRSQR